jgi:hypothetical protein
MLPADEYERIYRTKGRTAADDAFEESMKADAKKLQKVLVVCLVLLAIGLYYL